MNSFLEKFINDSYEIETIVSDLNMILISLIENRGTNKEIRKLSLLVESLKVGGFVTAEMDIREDSAITTNAAKEIISKIYDQNTTIQDAINLIEKNNELDLNNLVNIKDLFKSRDIEITDDKKTVSAFKKALDQLDKSRRYEGKKIQKGDRIY